MTETMFCISELKGIMFSLVKESQLKVPQEGKNQNHGLASHLGHPIRFMCVRGMPVRGWGRTYQKFPPTQSYAPTK